MLKLSARSFSLAIALGVVGGAILVLSHVFFTPGKYLLIPYAAVVLGTTAVIRAEHLASFAERFMAGLTAFMIASLALYVRIGFETGGLPWAGHAWRIGVMLGIGVAINLATARLARSSRLAWDPESA